MSIHKELFSLGWRVEEMNKNPKHEIHLAKLIIVNLQDVEKETKICFFS